MPVTPSLCALCGVSVYGSNLAICPYHFGGGPEDWAAGNRVFCDFMHRGVVPVTPPGYSDDLFAEMRIRADPCES